MPIPEPYPDLDDLMLMIGEAGGRLSDIDASEGAAGNISLAIRWAVEPRRRFPIIEPITLPVPAPALADCGLLVTGSGRRLREIAELPVANLGFVRVNADGHTGTLYTSPERRFTRLTSEFNSHLAVHNDQMPSTNFSAVIHAQPLHLTYLSHVPRYQDFTFLNQHILRWEPELIVNLPEGVGVLPFIMPGSDELMAASVEALRTHKVILWGKHGVMARSDVSVKRACDLIEYVETGARYECLNLSMGEIGEGLTADQIRAIAANFNVQQRIY
jgi:rhamnulose-1-phosphate aldolase